MPENDSDFSNRWRQIKSYFSRRCLNEFKGLRTAAHKKKGEEAIWQRRFWEHQIRDEEDYTKYVEYIHYNSVKHGLAMSPKEWPYSTFHRFVRAGVYHEDWGMSEPLSFDRNIGNE